MRAYPRKKSQIYSFISLQSRESERKNPKRQKLNNPCCEGHHRQIARPDRPSPPHACCCRRPHLTRSRHACCWSWTDRTVVPPFQVRLLVSDLVFFFFLSYFVLIYLTTCYFVSCLVTLTES